MRVSPGGGVKVSLIVATYERPKFLELCLLSLTRQSFTDFEALVCEDGSGPETKEVVERIRRESGLEIQHFFQPHEGQRKSRIMNEGIRHARGEYLVWLDGDCIAHRDYVKNHWFERAPKSFLAGRRVVLGENFTKTVTRVDVASGLFDQFNRKLFLRNFPRRKSGTEMLLGRSLIIRNRLLRRLFRKDFLPDVLGSNFSVSKEAFLSVNGFDERFVGRGREDSELEHRLRLLGLRLKSVKNLCVQFHLWHSVGDFGMENERLLAEIRANKNPVCENGLVRT